MPPSATNSYYCAPTIVLYIYNSDRLAPKMTTNANRSFGFWTVTLVSESWVSKTPPAASGEPVSIPTGPAVAAKVAATCRWHSNLANGSGLRGC